MNITTETVVKKLKSFTQYSNNPIQYRESGLHNTMVDIDCATGDKESCTVKDLMDYHDTALEFYAKSLPTLARDGYVELSYATVKFRPAFEGALEGEE